MSLWVKVGNVMDDQVVWQGYGADGEVRVGVRSGRIRVEWEREGLETPDGSVSGKVFICFNIVAGWSFIVAKFKRGPLTTEVEVHIVQES